MYVTLGQFWTMISTQICTSYKVTRDNIRTYADKLSGTDDKLQQNPETTSWFADKDGDDQ